MSPQRGARVRRLLVDLSRGDTRGEALHRLRRRAGSVVGSRSPQPTTNAAASGAASSPDAVKAARLAQALALTAEAISKGESLERAVCRSVAALAEAQEWFTAWAVAEGAGRLPGGAAASAMGHAVVHHRRRQFERAWGAIGHLEDAALAATIPVEAVDAALATGSDAARRRALAIGAPTDAMDDASLVDLAGRFLVFGEREHAAAIVAELRRRPTVDLDDRRRTSRALVEGWLRRSPTSVPAGSIPVAVMGYQTPDHVLTSGNLGDYVQTLAMVGNLVRLSGVRFTGEAGLGELAAELQPRVRPELRSSTAAGAVHLVPVNRDFSSADTVPERTWMLAFGWHMHPLYDLKTDFPYHPNIRPLFVSFHVNRLEMLTEEGKAYLRRYGPVGCRDWTTVFLLLSAGIDAFFTGCLTTTIDALFPTRESVFRGRGAVGVIDLAASAAGNAANVRVYSHQADAYRSMPMVDGLRAASTALADYQRDLDRAITKRLHAYLPLVSLGVPVSLRLGSRGDVRFAGLTGLQPGDPRLEEMRGGIRALIADVFGKVLGGSDEEAVYDAWRALTRDRVAEARARFEAPLTVAPTTIDIDAAVVGSRAGSRRFGPHDAVDPGSVSDIVLCFDQNLLTPAAVLLESIVANASGQIRLWVLGRGLPGNYPDWLAAAFPSVPMTFLPCDHITFGSAGKRPRRLTSRITVSTMDRLLLPAMLEDVHRVVYLDVDTLMLDDVCRLVSVDLGGHPVGARDSNVSETSEWRRSATALDEAAALDLRRWIGYRHGFGHPALNAGALVMDLDRMRRDDFATTYLGWVEQYGLHDQDTMLAYVGPERCVLEPRWNAMPRLEDFDDPGLIHWASFGKPWDAELTYAQDRWRTYAERLGSRAGPAPVATDGVVGPAGSLTNPIQIAPAKAALPAEVARTVGGVIEEHLSYLGASGLRSLAAAVLALEAEGIEGVLVETGTARGGSAITMAAAKSAARRMKVYDVFGMIPPPGEKDGADVHQRYATIVSGASPGIGGETYYGYRDNLMAEVIDSFARHGLPVAENNVELIAGLFEHTITLDEPVALAHLDGDWYASTMTCLARIAPLLSVGGRLVIDDYYTWSGCRTAVNEYFAGRSGFRFERRERLHIVRE